MVRRTGYKTLCVAIGAGDLDALGRGVRMDPDAAAHWKPIMDAAFIGSNPGADVHATDEFGRTALHWAALQGVRADYLAALVDHGADPGSKDDFGDTPLDLAREKKRAKAIAYLESIR